MTLLYCAWEGLLLQGCCSRCDGSGCRAWTWRLGCAGAKTSGFKKAVAAAAAAAEDDNADSDEDWGRGAKGGKGRKGGKGGGKGGGAKGGKGSARAGATGKAEPGVQQQQQKEGGKKGGTHAHADVAARLLSADALTRAVLGWAPEVRFHTNPPVPAGCHP